MPSIRTDYLTGRARLMADLRSTILEKRLVALTGLGGIGKTQSALEYVRLHKDDYTNVLWVDADTDTSLKNSYFKIIKNLNPSLYEDVTSDQILDFTTRWLEANKNWLLIFDNADKPCLLKPYLINNPSGHILLTSQEQNFDSTGRRFFNVDVTVMSQQDAGDFLLTRTHRENETSELSGVAELAQELGCLPLALEQAAAFIKAHNQPFGEYLKKYKSLQHELKLEMLEQFSADKAQYAKTVRTTWELSFRKIKKETPASAKLLDFCAFLNPDVISLDMLRQMRYFIGSGFSAWNLRTVLHSVRQIIPFIGKQSHSPLHSMDGIDSSLRAILIPLRRYSLITEDSSRNAFSMHRLVQMVVRTRMSERSRHNYVVKVANALLEIMPETVAVPSWSQFEILLPHVVTCTENAKQMSVQTIELALCTSNAGAYLRRRGSFHQALKLLKEACDMVIRVEGPEAENVFRIQALIGGTYNETQKYQEARLILEPMLDKLQSTPQPNLDIIVLYHTNLGHTYYGLGMYDKSKSYFERGIAIHKHYTHGDDNRLSDLYNNLGIVYYITGNRAKGIELQEEALNIRQRVLPPTDTRIAQSLHNVGSRYVDERRLLEALPLFETSLRIYSKSNLSKEHPDYKKVEDDYEKLLKRLKYNKSSPPRPRKAT